MFISFKYKSHCLCNYFHDERIRMSPQMITYYYKTDKQNWASRFELHNLQIHTRKSLESRYT